MNLKPGQIRDLKRLLTRVHLSLSQDRDDAGPDDEKQTGTCRVCSGVVIPKFRHTPNMFQPPVGTTVEIAATRDGFFCTECGNRYEFIPPDLPHHHMSS